MVIRKKVLNTTNVFVTYSKTQGFPGSSGSEESTWFFTMQDTWVWSLSQKDPVEEGMAPHSSNLAWRILWTEQFGGLQATTEQ